MSASTLPGGWFPEPGSSTSPYSGQSSISETRSPEAPYPNRQMSTHGRVANSQTQQQNQQAWNMTAMNILQTADHDALVLCANPSYLKALERCTEMEARYDTLQQCYSTLATSIPQVFKYIPNPMNVPIPTSDEDSAPATAFLSSERSDYPDIQYWDRSDCKESDLTEISDDNNNKLHFLEHKDGSAFTASEISGVRKAARSSFVTLLEEGRAPSTWSHASSKATNSFRKAVLKEYPEVGLCANNWKIDAVATEVYSQWSRGRKDEIAQSSKSKQKSRKRKSTTDSEAQPEKPSKRPKSTDSSTAAVPAPKEKKKKKKKPSNDPSSIESASENASLGRSDPSPTKPVSMDVELASGAPTTSAAPSPTRYDYRSPSPSRSPSPNIPSPNSQPKPISEPAPTSVQPAKTSISQPPNAVAGPSRLAKSVDIINPLAGLFGNKSPALSSSRLNQDIGSSDSPPDTDLSEPTSTSASIPTNSSKRSAPASLSTTNSSKLAAKAKPHRPGTADTAWNLFGREHMALNKHDSIDLVKAAYERVDKTRYETEEQRLKKLKKLAKKAQKEAAE